MERDGEDIARSYRVAGFGYLVTVDPNLTRFHQARCDRSGLNDPGEPEPLVDTLAEALGHLSFYRRPSWL